MRLMLANRNPDAVPPDRRDRRRIFAAGAVEERQRFADPQPQHPGRVVRSFARELDACAGSQSCSHMETRDASGPHGPGFA